MQLHNEILKTVLYYDIWLHPLTAKELYTFLPVNSMTFEQFSTRLKSGGAGEKILELDGYYFLKGRTPGVVTERNLRGAHAKRMWSMARLAMHIIKRFPFVRAIFVSGDLSKNSTHNASDVDFFILTEPDRLWIARSLLILFKKTFLFNKRKFFCLNLFSTTDHLKSDEHNIFQAMEIATLKPLFNSGLFVRYIQANDWIREYFPNFDLKLVTMPQASDRRSALQMLLELPFRVFNSTKLDRYLMYRMEKVWSKRYPFFDEQTRQQTFRCTPYESRAYAGNFQEKVLRLYDQRLKGHGLCSGSGGEL